MKKIPWLALIGGILCSLSWIGFAMGDPPSGKENDSVITFLLFAASMASWITVALRWPRRNQTDDI